MQEFAIATATTAMKGEKAHMKDLAEVVKKEFDAKYPGAWHVIVGKHFGSFVTHETKNIVYFFVGAVGFLVFKHG